MAGGRKNAARDDVTKLRADGVVRGPELPEFPMLDKNGFPVEWHPLAIAWWDALRKSPQALLMNTEPDWMSALGTCLMVHAMWQNGRWELAAEVRQREKEYGLTPLSRRIARIAVVGEEDYDPYSVGSAGVAGVTQIDDARRQRVIGQ